MTEVPFDIVEANRLCDEHGKRLGVRIEYRFDPGTKCITCRNELRFRFYEPNGRNHGIVFSFSEGDKLPYLIESAINGWQWWLEGQQAAA